MIRPPFFTLTPLRRRFLCLVTAVDGIRGPLVYLCAIAP